MGSPVFGFTSNLGKLLLAMSSLIRWPALNRLLIGGRGILTLYSSPGFHHLGALEAVAVPGSDDRVGQVQVIAVLIVLAWRVDVQQLGREVRVDCRGRDPQDDLDAARHLHVSLERLRLEHEHVGTVGEKRVGGMSAHEVGRLHLVGAALRVYGLRVVPGVAGLRVEALRERQQLRHAAGGRDRRHGMVRVVDVRRRRVVSVRWLGREAAARAQVVFRILGPGQEATRARPASGRRGRAARPHSEPRCRRP